MRFRYDIQGLRALSVLAVLIFHINQAWLPAGFVGVDIFFVISGFIVSSLILRTKEEFSWTQFYWGRIKRIIPAYLFLIVVASLFAGILFLNQDFNWFVESAKSALLFKSNHYFADFGSYFAPSAYELPLLHTWSLALEMQFYFILPLVLVLLPNRTILPLLFIIFFMLLIWAEYSIAYKETSLYFSLLARIPEFIVGVLLAIFMQSRSPLNEKKANIAGLIGFLIIVISFYIIDEKHFPGVYSLLPVAGASLILVSEKGILNRFLSLKLWVWIGDISYSLYLWHWPFLAFIRYITGEYELEIAVLIFYLIAVFLLSSFSYYFIETPFRKSKGKKTFIFLSGITLFIVSFLFTGDKFNRVFEPSLPLEYKRYADDKTICHGKRLDSCLRGVDKKSADVLVIGDSHAAQLNYFFDEVGKQHNMAFEVITASSCVPIQGFDIERISDWAQAACRSQIQEVNSRLTSYKNLVIAGFWEWQLDSEQFQQALYSFLDSHHLMFENIIIMAQLPSLKGNLLRTNRFQSLGLPLITEKSEKWAEANKEIGEMIQFWPNVVLFDPTNHSLFQNAPYAEEMPIYYDAHHLNEVGARHYARDLGDKFIHLLKQEGVFP